MSYILEAIGRVVGITGQWRSGCRTGMQARTMFSSALLIAGLILSGSHSLPSTKILIRKNNLQWMKVAKKTASHIIKTRSIDLNNAHGLAMETRLEKTVVPTGYKLKLEPYLDDGIFKGTVRINVTWLKEADEINIHCGHEVEISGSIAAAVFPGESKEHKIKIKEVQMDIKKPIATIYLEKNVPKSSTGYLEFKFNGNLETSSTEAFFKTTYKTDQEVERIVAGTQLRPNNARRMFPCFDEPEYKAPFELSVVRPRTMVALSNVPVARTEDIPDEPDAVWDHFERTPPMSTFTLGLVIADLNVLENSTKYTDNVGNNLELRVWGRPEYLSALKGLNEKLARTFACLADIWQVPLPLKRLDIVALPNFQGVKPADNWGLVIFKESDLSNIGYYQLARELSYQWLGAFTTPAWWSDAHLNKALVGYISSETSFKLQVGNDPEFDVEWPLTMLYAMYYEFSRRYPHSRITGMKQETTSVKIELMFRMFNNTLGADTFKKAMKVLLETHKFKTFTGEDVWKALNTAAILDNKISKNVDLKTVAHSWIEKDRLPFVTVDRNYDSNTISLSQKVFLRERPHDVPDADRMTWWVPIVLVTQEHLDFTKTKPVAWMNTKQMQLEQNPGKDKFVIVNPEEIAPFLVNYDSHNWHLLSEYLQSDKRTNIPELTRAKLLHDAWNLAYAGELNFATALNMTLFVKNERQHLVWYPVFTMIDHVGRHICQCVHEQFRAYVRMLLSPLYEELSKDIKEDEEGWRKNLRLHTKSVLCTAGYKPCIKDAQENYAKWMQAKNPDEGNPISDKFFCPVFKYGTKKEWEFGLQRVMSFPPSRTRSERTYLLKTLAGCPKDESKITRILNITMLEGNGNFSENDAFLILSMLTGSAPGYTTLYKFLSNNWDFLKEKYGHKTNFWDSLITTATSHFTTQEGLEMVSNLYMAHQGEFASSEHIIEKSMRNIREEVKWSNENIPVIKEWLEWYIATSGVKDNKYM